MEPWQTNYIDTKMSSLIETTKCTIEFKVALKERGLISNEEEEVLTIAGRTYGSRREASDMYSILKTRIKGYEGLLESLETTCQTGALTILQEGIRSFVSSMPRDGALEALHNIQMDNKHPIPQDLYISRSICNRILIDQRGVKLQTQDVFVFKDIDAIELSRLLNPLPIRSSTSQRSCVTCRHIYLVNDEDWEDLKIVSEAPIHLISREECGFVLQRSTKVTQLIQDYGLRKNGQLNAYVSEDEFVSQLLSADNKDGALICDSPGTGKTWLMRCLVEKFRVKAPNSVVLFVGLSTLSNSVQEMSHMLERAEALQFLLSCTLNSKQNAILLTTQVQKNTVELVLFLDGFDEIRDDCVNQITELLQSLNSFKTLRLIISSRPHMRKHLEKTFNLFSYDILPFSNEEQVNTLVAQWRKNNPEGDEIRLTQFANQCIRSFANIHRPEPKPRILNYPQLTHYRQT